MEITREQMKRFPRFLNHESARNYLRGIYGNRFCMSGIDYARDGSKIYSYALVKDKERYLEWRDKLANGEPVNDDWYKDTYQPCQITEKGKLTVFFMSTKKELRGNYHVENYRLL